MLATAEQLYRIQSAGSVSVKMCSKTYTQHTNIQLQTAIDKMPQHTDLLHIFRFSYFILESSVAAPQ